MKAVRTTVKQAIGVAALLPPFAARTRVALRRRINVVYAHYVGGPVPYYADFYAGSTLAQLERDLRRLAEHFRFAPLAEVVTDGRRPDESGRPPLAVTFDDGFDMIGNGVADVLDRHGVRATTFVITSMVGNASLMWRNKLSAIRALRPETTLVARYNELAAATGVARIARGEDVLAASTGWPMHRKEELVDALWSRCEMPPLHRFLEEHRPYFTWEGLREWVARGHSVGLHTATHPYCGRLRRSDLDAELVAPARLLKERVAADVLPLSYPFGSRLPRDVERELFEDGVFDWAFGIEGFAPRGTAPYRLERACIEGELAFPVFGKALLGLPRA